MFKERFIRLCAKRGVSPSYVVKQIGISSAAFSQWTENTIPRRTTVLKIADYFGVSPDYFTEDTKKSPDSENQGIEVSSDVAKHMERIMKELEQEEALMFDGEPLDEESLELIRASLKNAYAIAMAKKPIKKGSEKKK